MTEDAVVGVSILVAVFIVMFMFMHIIDLRQQRFPELGSCAFPKGSWVYERWTRTVWSECQ
jgi:hypothetical protein